MRNALFTPTAPMNSRVSVAHNPQPGGPIILLVGHNHGTSGPLG